MCKGLLILFFFPFIVGCNFFEEKKLDPDTLRICASFDPISFDPRIAGDGNSQAILHLLFEGLTRTEGDGKIVPAIAEKIEVSKDLLTYTFTLKRTYWSNGEPLTAHDFEKSWKKTISLEFTSKYSYPFHIIKNVKAYRANTKSIHEVGIYAKTDEIFVVKLEHPAPYFLELISNPVFSPVHKTLNKKDHDLSCSSDFIGNGPFKIKNWHFKEKISLEKNLFYWNAEKIPLKNIKISIVPEEQVAVLLFEKGEVDWIGKPLSKIPLDSLSFLKKNQCLEYSPPSTLYHYIINTETPPFNNKKIRQALGLAINREEIVKNFLESNEMPAFSILPPHSTLQKKAIFTDNDKKRAKALFSEGLKELNLTIEEFPQIYITHVISDKKFPEIIQQQWKEIFGIKVKINKLDWHSCLSKMKKNEYHLIGISWESWINDPIYNLRFYEIQKKDINPEIISLLNQSDHEVNPDKRRLYLQQAEYKLIDDMYIIPIYFRTDPCLKKKYVKGFFFTPQGNPDFTYTYIDNK